MVLTVTGVMKRVWWGMSGGVCGAWTTTCAVTATTTTDTAQHTLSLEYRPAWNLSPGWNRKMCFCNTHTERFYACKYCGCLIVYEISFLF